MLFLAVAEAAATAATAAAGAATTDVPLSGLLEFQSHWLWTLVVAFHLSFVFAYAMGANEVSNAFATSVGSGAISLRAAYALATVVETAGGVLLGYKVLETLRFKVIDLDMYATAPNELLLGQVAILTGCAMWMLSATLLRFPVSSTHSHIGSIIGFSLLMRGPSGLHLNHVYTIIASWVVSPMLSGLISAILYIIVDFAVLRRADPLKCGFRALPILYLFVFALNTFMVVYHGSKWLGFDQFTALPAFGICLVVGLLAGLICQFIVRPFLVKWVDRKAGQGNGRDEIAGLNDPVPTVVTLNSTRTTATSPRKATTGQRNEQQFSLKPRRFAHWLLPDRFRRDDPRTLRLFSAIQVFTGCFTGFSHGSKDIPNTIAPLATLLFVYSTDSVPHSQETPLWILFYGAAGACVGFWTMGHRVIGTVGSEFTDLDPYCGFCVELGTAMTVLVASKLGIPISMTLCIVGSIMSVGAVRGSVPVNWALFRNVFLAWVCTFPLSGVFAACTMFVLRFFFL